MKIIISILSMVGFAACTSQGISSDKVPSVVLNAFQSKYPVPEDVDWEKKNEMYEAELDLNDSTELTVQINSGGKIIMEKSDAHPGSLPPAILTLLSKEYKEHKIDDLEKVEKEGRIYYQIELEGKKKDVKLVFTNEGTLTTELSYWD